MDYPVRQPPHIRQSRLPLGEPLMLHTKVTRGDGRHAELATDLNVIKPIVFQSDSLIAQPGMLGKTEIASTAFHALPPGKLEIDLLTLLHCPASRIVSDGNGEREGAVCDIRRGCWHRTG